MDFLNNLVIPQPDYNLELLNGLLIFALMIFLVHSGILFGSMLLSVFYKPNEYSEKSKNQYLFSKEMSQLITGDLTKLLGIGLVPFLAIIMFYTQLLHNADVNVVGYLLLSFLLYFVGISFLFRYKKSYELDALFVKIKKQVKDVDFDEIDTVNSGTRKRAGFWGVVFLFVSFWIFIGSISLAVDKQMWDKYISVFWLFISGEFIIKFLHFISASIAIASTTYLFIKFIWNKDDKNYDNKYNQFSIKQATKIAIIFSLAQPVFFVINIVSTPKYALNSSIFLIVLAAVILVFLAVVFLYISAKTQKLKYVTYSFIFSVLFVSLIGAKEKSAFGVSNMDQIAELDKQYDVYHEEFMASLGRSTVEVSGEEIYQRCMACHKDEDTPAAPAHKNIINKYLDDRDALVAFINNPVPVNPDYPPMPNQGLKPKEVEAVADFLLEKYGGKSEEEATE
jgi:cytochrome c